MPPQANDRAHPRVRGALSEGGALIGLADYGTIRITPGEAPEKRPLDPTRRPSRAEGAA